MGTLTANYSLNLLSGNFWFGAPDYEEISFNESQVIFFHPDLSTAWWFGEFEINGSGDLVDGTFDRFHLLDYQGLIAFEGEGFSIKVVDGYVDFLQADNSFGLVTSFLSGDDAVLGSADADTLVGMGGNDVVNGNGGDDDLNGNLGSDLVTGGAGRDYVRGGQGDDTVRGGADDDWHVNGSIGNDLVYGDLGNDSVFGGQGDDLVFGGDGDDWLSGDRGQDTLSGGAGADRFAVRSGGGGDRIDDFSAAQGDRLELEAGLNGSGIDSYAALQPHITGDGQGNTLIDLGGGNSLLLLGVQPAGLTADDVLFV